MKWILNFSKINVRVKILKCTSNELEFFQRGEGFKTSETYSKLASKLSLGDMTLAIQTI